MFISSPTGDTAFLRCTAFPDYIMYLTEISPTLASALREVSNVTATLDFTEAILLTKIEEFTRLLTHSYSR